jgi:hypothetical protein
VPRKVAVDLDHARLREIRAQTLHFDLSLRPPKAKSFVALSPSAVRRTLEQEWTDFAQELTMPGGVEREAFCKLGLDYLAQVSAETVPTDGVTDAV